MHGKSAFMGNCYQKSWKNSLSVKTPILLKCPKIDGQTKVVEFFKKTEAHLHFRCSVLRDKTIRGYVLSISTFHLKVFLHYCSLDFSVMYSKLILKVLQSISKLSWKHLYLFCDLPNSEKRCRFW